ncbi:hypothetical protein OG592_41765 (plasmid) [Streptomyces avidinii]|uniref:hypothetical protein n=1 Tax=Streptomyces avidinii TaxID=1895 RepID=UPI002F9160C4|nr:hypothetical protein OG592_41765 [Streptomyces avidinii]
MKKLVTGVGLALGGAALMVVTQGSAQASETPAPVARAAAVQAENPDNAPQRFAGLGKLAGKAAKAAGRAADRATVHGKAAAELASDAALESAGSLSNFFGVAPGSTLPDGSSVETVFDK